MGWYTTIDPSTVRIEAARFIDRNNSDTWKVVKHTLRGNTLWVVAEISRDGRKEKAIICTIYRRWRDGIVGWKDMCESSGPANYNVPLGYLKEVPVANQEWRDKVIECYARQRRKFTIGEVVEIVGRVVPRVRITQVKPLRGEFDGVIYRLRRKFIGKTIAEPTCEQHKEI